MRKLPREGAIAIDGGYAFNKIIDEIRKDHTSHGVNDPTQKYFAWNYEAYWTCDTTSKQIYDANTLIQPEFKPGMKVKFKEYMTGVRKDTIATIDHCSEREDAYYLEEWAGVFPHSILELVEESKGLKEDDTIVFHGPNGPVEYVVISSHCENKHGSNDQIFRDLGIADRYTLCDGYYGYTSDRGGTWPNFKAYDYPALQRLVDHLHHLCAEATVKEEPMPSFEEVKRRYPIGTKYKCASRGGTVHTVTEQTFSYPTSDAHRMIHAEDGKGCLYYDGKWAEIVMNKSGFAVGDKVLITKGRTNFNKSMEQYVGKVATLTLCIGSSHFRIDLDGGSWSWSANEGHFVGYEEETIPEPIWESKFKLDDRVKVCSQGKCNGYGYYIMGGGEFQRIWGSALDEGIITKKDIVTTPDGKREWYYHLDCHGPNGYIAEHALTLVPKPVFDLKPLEKAIGEIKHKYDTTDIKDVLTKEYPVGTKFVPLNYDGNAVYDAVTVKSEWKVCTTPDGQHAWFVDRDDNPTHTGIIYKRDTMSHSPIISEVKYDHVIEIDKAGHVKSKWMTSKTIHRDEPSERSTFKVKKLSFKRI